MKLSNMGIDLEIEVDKIVAYSLNDILKSFEKDLKLIKETGEPVGYVSWDDIEEDKKEIEKEVRALKRVLKLYTTN